MPDINRYESAIDIINQAAVEVGLSPTNDITSPADEAITQFRYLLTTAGRRLIYHFPWERLVKEYTFTLNPALDPQVYDLPADFAYMIDQTGWMRDQNVPLAGPLSSQDWQYLEGRNLLSSTIYASFRLWEGKLYIYSQGQMMD